MNAANSKLEIRNPKQFRKRQRASLEVIWGEISGYSCFGFVSDFGIRDSDFSL